MQLCFQNFLFIYEASISDLTILFWKRFYKNGDTSISCDIYDI